MDSILPERLPALVRPAFDLVLRRIRSLKRCVQACGCKIMTPRYACNLAPGCISSEPTFAGAKKKTKKRIKGPDNPTCYVFPKDVSSMCARCMDAITEHPDAQNAAPATTSATASPKCCACHDFATASPKCCACHDFARPPPRARQHPVPLDSCRMRPLPHKHTPRCTEYCGCHDFGNGIAKVLRLPRFRNGIAKVPRLLPNATPATQTHTQMHKMLRLPRLRQRHRQSAAPAQTHTQMHKMLRLSQRHRQSAAPATISHAPRRARDNILSL